MGSFYHYRITFDFHYYFWLEVSFIGYKYGFTIFWFPFPWNIIFHSFTLSVCVSLELKYVSCKQHIVLFFKNPSSLCLLIDKFHLFTFREIIDM